MQVFTEDRKGASGRDLLSQRADDALYNDLYREFDRRMTETPCPKGRVVLCGEMSRSIKVILDWVSQQSAQLVVVADDFITPAWLAKNAARLDFLVVDGDCMADTVAMVDFCMQVRQAAPDLKIIIISKDVRENDLSCERMMACDATLKWPVTAHCLSLGAHAAKLNHRSFLLARGYSAHIANGPQQ